MNTIQFSVKHRFGPWRWITRHNRKLPMNWNECSLWHLLTWCRWKNHPKAAEIVAYRFLKISPRIYFNLKAAYLIEINKHLSFFKKESRLTKILLPSFRFQGRRYYGPMDENRNVTVIENAIADGAYLNYLRHPERVQHLDLLCAALYRPGNIFIRIERLFNGRDIRHRLNKDTVEARARKFAHLPLHVKHAILIQYEGCRNLIIDRHRSIFQGQTQKKSSYGWPGIIFDLAGDKLGDITRVEQLLVWDVMLMLKKSEEESRQLKPQLKIA